MEHGYAEVRKVQGGGGSSSLEQASVDYPKMAAFNHLHGRSQSVGGRNEFGAMTHRPSNAYRGVSESVMSLAGVR